MNRKIAIKMGPAAALVVLCLTPAFSQGNKAFASSSPQSTVVSTWKAYQQSSVSDVQKVENTAELYLELPLLNQYNESLTLPDFLMTPGTAINKYEDGRLSYFFDGEQSTGNDWVTSFNYTPTVNSVSVSGNSATIVITPSATETVQGVSTPTPLEYPFAQHTLTLQKSNGQWLVSSDQFSDEFLQTYGSNPNWQSMITSLPSAVKTQSAATTVITPLVNKNIGSGATVVSNGDPRLSSSSSSSSLIQPNRTGGGTGTFYGESLNDVQYYASTYSDNTDGFDSTPYNTLFVNLNPNDCANFLSQVQWYGTGVASNTATSITKHSLPMTPTGTHPWYADASSAQAAWNNVFTYIADGQANYANNLLGPQLQAESVSTVLPGDPVEDTSEPDGHMLVVYSSGSNTWSTVTVSAHTANHANDLISQIYGSTQPSTINFFALMGIRTS